MLGIWTWEVADLPVSRRHDGRHHVLCRDGHCCCARRAQWPTTAHRLSLWAPVLLSVGMTTLFLDLEHKLYVFRFYTTLQPTSPMSWGSWVLMLVYPLSMLQIASVLRARLSAAAGLRGASAAGHAVARYCASVCDAPSPWAVSPRASPWVSTPGILLSGFSARPFWNTSILGPLFLVSGLSSAAALVLLVARDHAERQAFVRIDLGLIAVELLFIGLLIIGLASGGRVQMEALELILGGPFTLVFWVGFVALGLVVPLLLEVVELKASFRLALLAPVLVLAGGFLLRQVTLDVGQTSTWSNYSLSYDGSLLERLRHVRED